MTPEQRLDQLERMALLMHQDVIRSNRAARRQLLSFKMYFAAVDQQEIARAAAERKPNDAEIRESLRRATERRNQAFEELKQSIEASRNSRRKAKR